MIILSVYLTSNKQHNFETVYPYTACLIQCHRLFYAFIASQFMFLALL